MATGALGIEREERGEVDLGGGEAQRRARGGKWASGERARGARGWSPYPPRRRRRGGFGGDATWARTGSGEQRRRPGRKMGWAWSGGPRPIPLFLFSLDLLFLFYFSFISLLFSFSFVKCQMST